MVTMYNFTRVAVLGQWCRKLYASLVLGYISGEIA